MAFGRTSHGGPEEGGDRPFSFGPVLEDRGIRADLLPLEKVYGTLEPSEAREIKLLREDNAKLKRMVADLSLEKVKLQDVLAKKW